jgi:hypothetical protein
MGAIIPYLSDLYREERSLGTYLNENMRQTDFLSKQKLAHVMTVILDRSQLKTAMGLPSDFKIRPEEIPDMISSVDHMGLMSFPPFINSNIIYAAWLKQNYAGMRFQCVLTCMGVPLNNASFPRGFYLAGKRIPFFRRKSERWCSWHVPGSHMQLKTHPSQDYAYLFQTLQSWIQHVNAFRFPWAHQELMVFNHMMWQRFAAPLGLEVLTISGEDVFTEWLNHNFGTWFQEVLLGGNPKALVEINRSFEGCPGAWEKNLKRGTHLFWDISETGRERKPMQLSKNGRELKSDRMTLVLSRDSIFEALNEKRIIPSLFSFFGLLSYDAGLSLAGGFNQLEYLFEMNHRWLGLQQKGVIPQEAIMTPPKALCGFQVCQASGIEFMFENQLTSEVIQEVLGYPLGSILQS